MMYSINVMSKTRLIDRFIELPYSSQDERTLSWGGSCGNSVERFF